LPNQIASIPTFHPPNRKQVICKVNDYKSLILLSCPLFWMPIEKHRV